MHPHSYRSDICCKHRNIPRSRRRLGKSTCITWRSQQNWPPWLLAICSSLLPSTFLSCHPPFSLSMSICTADDSHSFYVGLNVWHVSSPSQPNENTHRKVVNEIRSNIEKWATLLSSWWFISSILHLQCFMQRRSYLLIQRSSGTTRVCPCLAWQRRATKVNEVSWHPIKNQFLTLF